MTVLLVFPLTSLLFCSVPRCLKKYIYIKSENQNYRVSYVWIGFSLLYVFAFSFHSLIVILQGVLSALCVFQKSSIAFNTCPICMCRLGTENDLKTHMLRSHPGDGFHRKTLQQVMIKNKW